MMFLVQTAGAPKAKSTLKKTRSSPAKVKSKSASSARTVATLKSRVALLTAENKALRLQRDEMASRFAALKVRMAEQFKEMQQGVQQRINNGETKAGIMEYVKAGFATALGVIAAIAVVDLVVNAVEDIRDDDDDDRNDDDRNDTSDDNDDNDVDAGNDDSDWFGF